MSSDTYVNRILAHNPGLTLANVTFWPDLTGCTDTSLIPSDYLDGAPIYHSATGKCYQFNNDGSIAYYAQYGYNPALATGVVFAVIFGLLTVLHFGLAAKSRRWWLFVVGVGGITELIGWVGRALSGTDNTASVNASNYFLVQIVCLTIAPVFFSAACYATLVIIVAHLSQFGDTHSRFSPRRLTWFFVTTDIISLVMQAAGGGITSGANSISTQTTGTHIFLAGIAFQLVCMVIFSGLYAEFFYKYTRDHKLPRKIAYLGSGVGLASLLIIIRGIYRTIELAQGWNGYLITRERYFLGLDAAMMVLCMTVLAVSHPVFTLPKEPGTTPGASDTINSTSSQSSFDRSQPKMEEINTA
ncbi:uncharacterized protein L969DRAFT_52471 [Mixia osmundae IAM 14324]|uniref:RTA1-domain-containing protein n=1 Tax=Mixia osmundae (strain CBS 9802 / IAM 14324 / JCM 22182 / KY 12970) TaxID=764103 RepID=G7EA55_MIXOS|nr:uncharacterized protein L969DRAFT_52471 [Mixia osmundae IAM 14324]KEI37613.1 hypothetical protein L969DRAFT_52471 [Mixia osmundae IAM 14324]GAA99715.1 hypothetical protein E5Q_06418 [Mixia osmundae IAM 14324]